MEVGTNILRSKVELAVKKMRWRKVEGSDGVVVEMVEAAGEFTMAKIVELSNKFYRTGKIPERMRESQFIKKYQIRRKL